MNFEFLQLTQILSRNQGAPASARLSRGTLAIVGRYMQHAEVEFVYVTRLGVTAMHSQYCPSAILISGDNVVVAELSDDPLIYDRRNLHGVMKSLHTGRNWFYGDTGLYDEESLSMKREDISYTTRYAPVPTNASDWIICPAKTHTEFIVALHDAGDIRLRGFYVKARFVDTMMKFHGTLSYFDGIIDLGHDWVLLFGLSMRIGNHPLSRAVLVNINTHAMHSYNIFHSTNLRQRIQRVIEMADGRLFMLLECGKAVVWTPFRDAFDMKIDITHYNIRLPGLALLRDGRVLISGGGVDFAKTKRRSPMNFIVDTKDGSARRIGDFALGLSDLILFMPEDGEMRLRNPERVNECIDGENDAGKKSEWCDECGKETRAAVYYCNDTHCNRTIIPLTNEL